MRINRGCSTISKQGINVLCVRCILGDGSSRYGMVKNVPVNYAIRFSGPVTALTPAASGMASDLTSSASAVLRQV
jgi:hypothetical protein